MKQKIYLKIIILYIIILFTKHISCVYILINSTSCKPISINMIFLTYCKILWNRSQNILAVHKHKTLWLNTHHTKNIKNLYTICQNTVTIYYYLLRTKAFKHANITNSVWTPPSISNCICAFFLRFTTEVTRTIRHVFVLF